MLEGAVLDVSPVLIERFLYESNRLNDIYAVSEVERSIAAKVIGSDDIDIGALEEYASVAAEAAMLREFSNLIPVDRIRGGFPEGGLMIRHTLGQIIRKAKENAASPFIVYCEFLRLSPFTAGNGPSARLLWLWQTLRFGSGVRESFLLHFYQQAIICMAED